jgi:NAD+ synthase (glutamine-hydrolysing)
MAGGFAVLKDVSKTQVYALSKHLNASAGREGKEPPIPENTITRPPTAELRPGQKDEDDLPPYSALDPILTAYVEQGLGVEDLLARGFLPEMVFRIIGLVDGNEYKRRQAPPGIRITPRAFGRDRRMPITNRYRAESQGRERGKVEVARPRKAPDPDTRRARAAGRKG